ncbi:MAG TPA: hypothetical protein VEA35_01505 [Ramlibacter sp.]|nr:hypothetical protein [Ramlibacter sp.]
MHKVFGVFPDLPAADRALERLVQAQFAKERIHLSSALKEEHDPHQPRNQSVLGSLGGFWANLIQSNNQHEQMLTEAVRGGQVVVGVDAATDELAQRARQLLRECGALRLDERDDGGRLPDPPEPWHPSQGRNEPAGTHSFTGSDANVGMPARERATAAGGEPHAGLSEEPRAGGADLLGRTPQDRGR